MTSAATPHNPLILGVTRFSVLTARSLTNWDLSRGGGVEEAAAKLFDPARLEKRFRLFEAITLPFLRAEAAASEEFHLLVITSTLLPWLWFKRLRGLVGDIPGIKLIRLSPERSIGTTINKEAARRLHDNHTSVVTYRLDDDDALFVGHTEALQRASNGNIGKIITHPNGLYLTTDGSDGLLHMSDMVYPSIALGLAYVSQRDSIMNIFSCGRHSATGQRYELVMPQRPRAWIRTVHDAADTYARMKKGTQYQAYPPSHLSELLQNEFGALDFTAVHAALVY